MPIEAIAQIGSLESLPNLNNIQKAPSQNFEKLFSNGIESLNENLLKADSVLQDMAMNKPVSAHEVMLIMESAKMDLRLAVEVRNKLLEGYQEIMRMQV
ncbi:flagellar hook-basal body complex protein FliE [Flocculibacter collagenilyticus]|uniref:flagellar hook-basal body complex protein FliE n=1 Tax=Flocculibacter collagenilyticus TaxID=2744479 RepID=UPI0018F78EE5|nr:flagellar hook-basal body complex protein FliE [Flocculibacter collagenilyticus]